MLEVIQNNKYTVTKKADVDLLREGLAAVKITTKKVLAIGGSGTKILSTASTYDINSNTWTVNLPKLNTARKCASACVLQAFVYIFFGWHSLGNLNSIEIISIASLFPKSIARWLLINLPQNVLTPRIYPAVAPINDN